VTTVLALGAVPLVAATDGKLFLLLGAAIAGLAFGMLLNTLLMGRKRRK
jgi:hypothetical protein